VTDGDVRGRWRASRTSPGSTRRPVLFARRRQRAAWRATRVVRALYERRRPLRACATVQVSTTGGRR
jgi:hypothetical protein